MLVSFQKEILPASCKPIGYAWLIANFALKLPLRQLCCVSEKRLASQTLQNGNWLVYDAQLMVEDIPFDHLEFALKHEYLDLLILKKILNAFSLEAISQHISINPKRILSKKIWFYYEFLLKIELPLQDLGVGKYDNLLDEKKYIVNSNPVKSKRHKINNNLLGTQNFCPIIKRTKKLQSYLDTNFSNEISNVIGKVSKSLIRRASSFLLLCDSKASFEIEGERPPKNRIENWGRIINEAGKTSLSLGEIQRLHAILLEDSRFIKIGLREDEVFIGERGRDNYPIPEFIGAKSKDLEELMQDYLELEKKLTINSVDPILQAAVLAFAFVYIHPLEDGNGRIHRYLLHHVLASRNFYSKGMIFPISNVILEKMDKYRDILVSHTEPLMPLIEWEATDAGNVRVLNETEDLYRYFDATQSCEFIYECVQITIKETLPNELKYLTSFDKAYEAINEIIEMPDNKIKSLITFILQNDNKLSRTKKEKFYRELTPQEIEKIEAIIQEYFSS